ncbi:OpgC family protein [Rhizobium halophytocola]|uniref:DUF1624 domain-containing protein n=1 Tax=Rhizobium halophytocola TaxID=735519 RepID=A0ABS4E3V7_9HYPH|nr:OpgC domain-containing protein [Rhizobium halophytocola]MBP1852635.1 hypothetical protein [Rhizobium halophytocola]
MKRLDVIDGMRGYFLVFMLINHLVFAGGLWLVELNHRNLGFVEDAQGFVFLSGLLTGMVYSRRMMRDGFIAGRDKIWHRVFELYKYAMGIILVVLALEMLLPGASKIWQNWLGDASLTDPFRLATIGTFLYQPTFMDILPQYIIYMFFAPLVIWLCLTGRWTMVIAGSLLLWMAAQLGLQRLFTVPLDQWLQPAPKELGIRASFNLFGWQIVFFSGVVAGTLTSMKTIQWREVFNPERTRIVQIAAMVLLFFLPLRILTAHGWMPGFVLEKFGLMEVRADFGPVYLVNFAAAGYAIAWLLIAGPLHHNQWVSKSANVLTSLFSLKFLQLLGRHSLQIYTWHVLIVYAVGYIDAQTGQLGQVSKTIIAIGSLALLFIPALWREREKIFPPNVPGAAADQKATPRTA